MSKKKVERPAYIIKVTRDWRYGKRARFWEIQKWYERAEGGYWDRACKGGIAYTELGLKWAVKRKLKKMQIGNSTNYYSLNWTHIEPN
jgi:hypothetical protein